MYNAALVAAKKVPAWAWLAGAAGVALYVIKKGGLANAAEGAAAGAVSSAGGVVKGAAGGVVLGLGDVIGLPRTNTTLCQKARALGDNYGASKYCTASEFIAWQKRGVEQSIKDFFGF